MEVPGKACAGWVVSKVAVFLVLIFLVVGGLPGNMGHAVVLALLLLCIPLPHDLTFPFGRVMV